MTRSCLAWLLGFAVLVSGSDAPASGGGKLRVYIGTYTQAKGEGIFLSELDLASGKMTEPQLAGEAVNPSFLAIHPSKRFLYAVAEVSTVGGKKTGGVIAFSIDPSSGRLAKLNAQASEGAGPCHLVVDRTGKNVLVANYGGGSVACLPIQEDGSLKPASSSVQHRGKSVNPQRQEGPHAHSINLDAANRFAFAADLGLDEVRVYRFDAETGKLAPNDPPAAKTPPGGGPRHFAFHPNGKSAFVINEMGNTITAFSYDAAKGSLTPVQTISTLPAGFEGTSHTAEVVVHPNGRFVYGSNRGHDSIALFEVDPATGKLKAAGHEPTQGKAPRNFAVDPTGAYLLAENQGSDTIVPFRIDPATGKLTATGQTIKVPRPVCVRFVAVE